MEDRQTDMEAAGCEVNGGAPARSREIRIGRVKVVIVIVVIVIIKVVIVTAVLL